MSLVLVSTSALADFDGSTVYTGSCKLISTGKFYGVPAITPASKNCFDVANRDARASCWVDNYIGKGAFSRNDRELTFNPKLNDFASVGCTWTLWGIPVEPNREKFWPGHARCKRELMRCVVETNWIANTETAYYNFQVAEYKKELHRLAIESAKNATGDKKEAADRLVAQLGVCLKATNDKEQVRQCYVKFRDTYMAL